MSRLMRAIGSLAVALFLLLPGGVACSRQSGGGGTDAEAGSTKKGDGEEEAKEDDRVPVEVVTIGRGAIEEVLRFSTNLEAEEAVQVVSQAQRRVTQLLVEEGDEVGSGQVLLRLQDEEQRTELARVESQLAKASKEYERQRSLFDQQLISEQLFNDTAYELEQLQLRLADAQRELSYATVRAPIGGKVTQRLVNVGDQVTINQHLFDMVDFNSIVARVYVPEKAISRLAIGQRARVLADAFGSEPRFGTVERIAPVVDPRSGTVKVTIAIPRGAELLPGMYVSVELVTETHEDAVLVPKRAVVYDDDQMYVFKVVEQPAAATVADEGVDEKGRSAATGMNGTAKGPELVVERLLLVPALESREHVEPAAGVEAGDRVVVAGQTGLKSGSAVRLVGGAE